MIILLILISIPINDFEPLAAGIFAQAQAQEPKAQEPKAQEPKYPIRSNWWSGCKDWKHMTTGIHAGKYDTEWLKSLSNEELQSLHSDDHEAKQPFRRFRWFAR
jgi:creatinine amidohydrolase/Fe(II)-dependent formamide hydrolase-like protein